MQTEIIWHALRQSILAVIENNDTLPENIRIQKEKIQIGKSQIGTRHYLPFFLPSSMAKGLYVCIAAFLIYLVVTPMC